MLFNSPSALFSSPDLSCSLFSNTLPYQISLSLQAFPYHHLFPSLLEKQRCLFYLSPDAQKPALPILLQNPIGSVPSYLSFSLPASPLTHLFYVRNPYRKLHRLPLANSSFFPLRLSYGCTNDLSPCPRFPCSPPMTGVMIT